MGKRPDKSFLPVVQLGQGKLRNEGDALAVLHDPHEGLYASQVIALLAPCRRLQTAELYQLVAETVPFVQQPEVFARKVGRTDELLAEEEVVFSHIGEELFMVEWRAVHSLQAADPCQNAGVDIAPPDSPAHIFCLHFRNPDVHLRMFVHQLGKEVRDEIGCDGGQNAHFKGAGKRLFLLFDGLPELLCP